MRVIRPVLLTLALGASVATSSTSDDPGWLGGGQVALHNGGDLPLEVGVAMTSWSSPVDCALVEEVPALLPHVPLDDPGWTDTLWPLELALVDPSELLDHPCRVARVQVAGLGSRMLYWRTDTLWYSYPQRAEDPASIGSPVVSVLAGAPEPFRDGRDSLVFPDDPEAIPSCAAPQDAFGWDGPTGHLGVREVVPSEACPTVRVEQENGSLRDLTVCVPPELFPFDVGDRLDVVSDGDHLRITDAERGLELRIALGDPTPFGIPLVLDGASGCVTPFAAGPALVPAVWVGDERLEGIVTWPLPDRKGLLAVLPPVRPLIRDAAQPVRRGVHTALLTER